MNFTDEQKARAKQEAIVAFEKAIEAEEKCYEMEKTDPAFTTRQHETYEIHLRDMRKKLATLKGEVPSNKRRRN
jgi:hypothetical protein